MLKALATTHDNRTALVVGLTRQETDDMLAGDEDGTALMLDLEAIDHPIQALVIVAGDDEGALRADMRSWGLLG